MKMSEKVDLLATALSKAQAEFKNPNLNKTVKKQYQDKMTSKLQIRLPEDIMGDLQMLARGHNMRPGAYARIMLIERMAQELHKYAESLRQVTQP